MPTASPTIHTATVTFLFSDIEGSTPLWDAQPEAMSAAAARHDLLLRGAIESAGGTVFKSAGDAFFAAFDSPEAAFGAALAAQTALAAEPWPLAGGAALRVRMALHTGPAERRQGDFFGAAPSRTARLLDAAHGGQTLLSDTAAAHAAERLPAGAALRLLGRFSLRGLSRPSDIWELTAPGLPSSFPPLRLPEAYPHNLPAQMTSFIGREAERASARALLSESRLVTLTGPGGTGKTRLALEAAADSRELYPDGTWLVELAALADPALIDQEIAATLGVREDSGRLRQALLAALRPQAALLILDNCEHLIDAVARLAEALLTLCPKLTVLATSREALGIGGEIILPLSSLSLPQASGQSPDTLGDCDSVRLFVARATAALPTFRFSAGNAAAVASVCTRLDGIPLALELAAARVQVLTPEQIDGRLGDRFRLLTGGLRTALPRQQTLRALVDWSYDLLSPPEQTLFARLSVFCGGWSLAAAEAVCAGGCVEEWEILDLVARLAAKSLVVAEPPENGQVRCRLLESLHSYAAGKRAESPGDAGALTQKHRDFFLALAEDAVPHLVGPDQALWLDRLECDAENFRAALTQARSDRDGTLPRLAGALSRFWYGRSYLTEGRGWLDAALAESPDDAGPARGRVLNGAGLLAWCCGDYGDARAYHERDLALRRAHGDPHGVAAALGNLCIVADSAGQQIEAQEYGQESLAQYEALGDRANSARMLNSMGVLAMSHGDFAGADALYRRALAEYRELSDAAGSAATLHNLGDLLFQQGQHAQAKPFFRSSLEAQRTLGSRQRIASTLLHLAEIAGAETRHAEVCLLQAAADAALTEDAVAVKTDFDPQKTLAASRAALGEEKFAFFWAQGARLEAAQSIEYVLDTYDGLVDDGLL